MTAATPATRVAALGRAAVAAVAAVVVAGLAVPLVARALVVAAGPPYPDPVPGQAVYDTAGILSAATVASAESTIDGIEARTGSEIVVYTQVKPESDTPRAAEADADALGEQWHVGRIGFDDGLVILFDLDASRRHGQVQLDGAPGFKGTYLSQSDLQRIYTDTMLPKLESGDLDGALLGALREIDAAATPERAAALERARQLDAVVGLVGAPIVLLLLVGWGIWHWRRYGRDPVYLDDPSIHVPAPPPALTPAAGALVYDGRSSRRTLTTAMVDLASRGLITFRDESGGLLGTSHEVGIELGARPAADAAAEHRRSVAGRQPIGPAEQYALAELRGLGADGYVDPTKLLDFGAKVSGFDQRLEAHVAERGWFAEAPSKVTTRWRARGVVAIALGVVAALAGINVPSNGLLLLGLAAIAGGVVLAVLASAMPARTMPGAMIRAMLAAYRRTLEKTMAQARSMDQVVAEAGLPWLETPDMAVVWSVALGLQHRVEEVLARSADDVRRDPARVVYLPAWYAAGGSAGTGAMAAGGGIFSSSAIPDFGGMMAALGTIGNSPSSSGGSGGGFGGGGGFSGGGGGAGGGF